MQASLLDLNTVRVSAINDGDARVGTIQDPSPPRCIFCVFLACLERRDLVFCGGILRYA